MICSEAAAFICLVSGGSQSGAACMCPVQHGLPTCSCMCERSCIANLQMGRGWLAEVMHAPFLHPPKEIALWRMGK